MAKHGYTETETDKEKEKGTQTSLVPLSASEEFLDSQEPSFNADGYLVLSDFWREKYARDYPNLDVEQEIGKASNRNNAASKSERKKNAKRYLVNWLNRVSGWRENDRKSPAKIATAAESNAAMAHRMIGDAMKKGGGDGQD